MRDHIVLLKNDHGPSYWPTRPSQIRRDHPPKFMVDCRSGGSSEQFQKAGSLVMFKHLIALVLVARSRASRSEGDRALGRSRGGLSTQDTSGRSRPVMSAAHRRSEGRCTANRRGRYALRLNIRSTDPASQNSQFLPRNRFEKRAKLPGRRHSRCYYLDLLECVRL
jgi:hypothetical protein